MFEGYRFTDEEKKQILSSMVILSDSRERSNKHITDPFDKHKIRWEKAKLDFCDYSFKIPKNEGVGINRDIYFNNFISIERKNSLEELSQCFCQERERFEKEFQRAKGKIVLLVENGAYGSIVEGKYKTEMNSKAYAASLHAFKHKYNLDIFFCNHLHSWHYIINTFYYYLRGFLNG